MKNPTFKFALREDLQNQKQFLPTRAEPKASGWDVRAAFPNRQDLIVRPFEQIKIPLGFRSFCPEGWWYELKPRSSTFAKKNILSLYGTIDETYEGELVFACQYLPPFGNYAYYNVPLNLNRDQTTDASSTIRYYNMQVKPVSTDDVVNYFSKSLQIKFGEAIGQLIPRKRDEMDVQEVSNEEYNELCQQRQGVRGAGGFGSSGH